MENWKSNAQFFWDNENLVAKMFIWPWPFDPVVILVSLALRVELPNSKHENKISRADNPTKKAAIGQRNVVHNCNFKANSSNFINFTNLPWALLNGRWNLIYSNYLISFIVSDEDSFSLLKLESLRKQYTDMESNLVHTARMPYLYGFLYFQGYNCGCAIYSSWLSFRGQELTW